MFFCCVLCLLGKGTNKRAINASRGVERLTAMSDELFSV